GQSYYGQRGEFCLAKRVKVEWLFQLLNTSKTTAYRILSQLDNWLEIQGTTGKGTHYTLKGFTKGS
ncbi:hypothetical protein D7V95_14215, partial [bacterium J10(2018)]